MFGNIARIIDKYIPVKIEITDIIEIIILAIAFYEIIAWFKKTKAWILVKGALKFVSLIGNTAESITLIINTILTNISDDHPLDMFFAASLQSRQTYLTKYVSIAVSIIP